ncbi:MAG: SMP-30/gluconolactonase/LRE family protein [Okeania sp. SIO3B3]|nr:SMP-30/gluconolactonase/LRE family protein [Okeania sp. SIO3B3]
MSDYQIVSDGGYPLSESPIWDVEKRVLYWCDIVRGELYQYEPQKNIVQIIASGLSVGGFTLTEQGGFMCAALNGLYYWTKDGGFKLIKESHDGLEFICNDTVADPTGRFIFGTKYYALEGKYPLAKLYSIDKDGSIKILDEGFHLPNGIGFSPDKKTMYFTDTIPREIYAYDYEVETGEASNKRVFAKIPETEGIPDGMTVDAEGYVWSAQWYGSCLVRYDPDGKVERYVKTPAKQTSSVIFGGDDLTDIYVTTAGDSARLPIAPPGYDFDANDIGGAVYKYNFGIKGMAEYKADLPFVLS